MNYSYYSAEIQTTYQKWDVRNCTSNIFEQDNQETATENYIIGSTTEDRK